MESCPYSLIEAMALGKPIVASSVPGIRDMVVDGESALLVPPGDPKAVASAMERVLADEALAHPIAVAPARRAGARSAFARMCVQTVRQLERVPAASVG